MNLNLLCVQMETSSRSWFFIKKKKKKEKRKGERGKRGKKTVKRKRKKETIGLSEFIERCVPIFQCHGFGSQVEVNELIQLFPARINRYIARLKSPFGKGIIAHRERIPWVYVFDKEQRERESYKVKFSVGRRTKAAGIYMKSARGRKNRQRM